jgi:hypothetical protein
VLNRDQLVELIHGREAEPYDRAIDVQISRLRQRLQDTGRESGLIKTVRGEGYVLALSVEGRAVMRLNAGQAAAALAVRPHDADPRAGPAGGAGVSLLLHLQERSAMMAGRPCAPRRCPGWRPCRCASSGMCR